MEDEYPISYPWGEMKRDNDEKGHPTTSPGWYSCANEMLLLLSFVRHKCLMGEYEEFKINQWPVMCKEMKRVKESIV